MSHENIIRAWKDSSFRDGLSEADQALLPQNPAGLMNLSDEQLGVVAGGIPVSTPMCTEGGPRCNYLKI